MQFHHYCIAKLLKKVAYSRKRASKKSKRISKLYCTNASFDWIRSFVWGTWKFKWRFLLTATQKVTEYVRINQWI